MPVKTGKTFGPCTLNNYDEGDITWLKSLECNVMTCSKEVGETGTPHLQFCITFKRSYSLAALKKLHPRVHWEFQNCPQDNNYCRKRDSELIIDRDERKKKGARSDIAIVKEVVKETLSMKEVLNVATSVQSVRMAELWLKYNEPKRPLDAVITIHYRYGKTGSGKTRPVWELYGVDRVFTPCSYKWWEGYDRHDVVLIDELRGDWCTFGQLLRLLDRYPYPVECKGGSRQIQATTWFITSSRPPSSLYSIATFDEQEKVDQLIRRMSTITHIGVDEDPLLELVGRRKFISEMKVDR